MIVVVFEVTLDPKDGHKYFDLAASLRPELEKIDGFISVERFESLTNENKFLSLSFWRDEDAVAAWHKNENHGYAQTLGKSTIFTDFQITVAKIFKQYTLADRQT
ncbi:MAG: antibiotic biosynthesis monooxygenase [Pseudomonadota bacterium]|nr:antibiotic biosynthesis monooxygenase [Pseudomonadota bacterium]